MSAGDTSRRFFSKDDFDKVIDTYSNTSIFVSFWYIGMCLKISIFFLIRLMWNTILSYCKKISKFGCHRFFFTKNKRAPTDVAEQLGMVTDSTFVKPSLPSLLHSAGVSKHHPMWVMPIDTLYSIDLSTREDNGFKWFEGSLPTHEELMQRNMLIDRTLFSRSSACIYISHEWPTNYHPDPHAEKIRMLQGVLKNLSNGLAVQTNYDAVLVDEKRCSVLVDEKPWSGEDWKEMLNTCFIWFDYFSIPQSVENQVFRQKAIQSIPAYIAHSQFFFILAPTLEYRENFTLGGKSNVTLCDRYTRLESGWNRFEELASIMTRDAAKVKSSTLLIESTILITRQSTFDSCFKHVGGGKFLCCEVGHVRYVDAENERSQKSQKLIKIPCDKDALYDIISGMINNRIRWEMNNQNWRLMRQLKAFFSLYVSDLRPDVCVSQQTTVEDFLREYCFESAYDCDFGWSPLRYSCIEANVPVVKKFIEMRCDVEEPLTQTSEFFMDRMGENILSQTCQVSNSAEHIQILDILLENGAKTSAEEKGDDCFCTSLARPRTVAAQYCGPFWFLNRFPDYDVNRSPKFQSRAILTWPIEAHLYFSSNIDILQSILDRKASLFIAGPLYAASLFHVACASPDSSTTLLQCIADHFFDKDEQSKQLLAQVINQQIWHPQYHVWMMKILTHFDFTIDWRPIFQWSELTCLMCAAYLGKHRVCQWLLENRADPFIEKKRDGATALSLANERDFPRVLNVIENFTKNNTI